MEIINAIGAALRMAFIVFWNIFWGLNVGFVFSAVIEELVSKDEMARLLPDSKPGSIARAAALGAASSSCSYAAVAMARSIVRKGGNFTAAMAFQFAATNLVLELSVLLIVLLGWQFGVAELVGGPVMIVALVMAFRLLLSPRQVEKAVRQAKKNLPGLMEGHADMSMARHQGSWRKRLASKEGIIALSHGFMMNWAMLWKDILLGVMIAGALSAWIPSRFWQALFFAGHPVAAAVVGAILGPLIAAASFTCSVGNIPFAAVLWQGGISFGGVIAFIFGDLIIPPILNIYRKYYGTEMTIRMGVIFYGVMVIAALLVEGLFTVLHLIPSGERHGIAEQDITLNYTTVFNSFFLLVAIGLGTIFVRSEGPAMLKSMAADNHHAGHH